MKRIFVVALASILLATACTKPHGSDDGLVPLQDDHLSSSGGGGGNISTASVPSAVMKAFKAQFPNATRIEWKKLSNGNYKVQFYVNSVKWEAIYTPTGTRVKLERD